MRRMPKDAEFTDDEARSLAEALNKFEPSDIRDALDGMSEAIARVGPPEKPGTSAVSSGPLDFGSIPPGVFIYRTDAKTVRMRLTVARITGGTYDEIELPPDDLRRVVAALLQELANRQAPRAR
jgi:hypothetical protein